MMSAEADLPSGSGPSTRALRFWLGLLLIVLFVVQLGSVGWGYFEMTDMMSRGNHEALYWHRFALALTCSVLAMMTIIGMVGLILDKAWAWRVIQVEVALQIVATVVTQVLEVVLAEPSRGRPELVLLSAIIGIVVWNTIPVGVLVLAVAGRPRAATL